MADLADSLERPPSGRAAAVWFDWFAHCRHRRNGAGVPWASPREMASFFCEAQRVFRSDAVLVDVGDVFTRRVERDAALSAAMAARNRPGYALRTLLADDRARSIACEATTAIAAGSAATPVLLSVPSPARWLELAVRQAGSQPDGAPQARHVEAAAMYVADLLRVFAPAGVDGLLLDEGAAPHSELADAESYTPVLNVAAHHGWPVWVRSDRAACWPDGYIPGVTGWLGRRAPEQPAPGQWGIVLSPEAGLQATPPGERGGVVLAVVPEAAEPDSLLRWVDRLT
jgi:hypothetical protein